MCRQVRRPWCCLTCTTYLLFCTALTPVVLSGVASAIAHMTHCAAAAVGHTWAILTQHDTMKSADCHPSTTQTHALPSCRLSTHAVNMRMHPPAHRTEAHSECVSHAEHDRMHWLLLQAAVGAVQLGVQGMQLAMWAYSLCLAFVPVE